MAKSVPVNRDTALDKRGFENKLGTGMLFNRLRI